MDVEKTIEFILNQHAKNEAEIGLGAALLRRAIRAGVKEARAERRRRQQLGEELSQAQREFSNTQREVAAELRELAAAQRRTEASLAAFIDSMRLGGNGHPKA